MAVNIIDYYQFDPTGVRDNTASFNRLVSDQSIAKPLPKVVFPEGIYKYSACPNLAIPNLNWEADGYVELAYTGVGNALTFNGGNNGVFNLRFDGFHLVTNDKAADTLSLTAVHHSHFRVHIHGAGIPQANIFQSYGQACLRMAWCVCTHFEDLSITPADIVQGIAPGVSMPGGRFNQGIVGIWLDMFNGAQTNDSTFERPILESLPLGVLINNAGDCAFDNGTIENGGNAVIINNGGHNVFRQVDIEGNSGKDFTFLGGAHDNLVLMCGNNGTVSVSQG